MIGKRQESENMPEGPTLREEHHESEEIRYNRDFINEHCDELESTVTSLMSSMMNAPAVQAGGNVSDKVNEFVDVYNELFELVKNYYCALHLTIENIRMATEQFADLDQGLGEALN